MPGKALAEIVPWAVVANVEDEWRTLQRACPEASPFLTWTWVSTWLRCVAEHFEPLIFRFIDREGPVALGALILRKEGGGSVLTSRRVLRLLETGDPEFDEVTIEYAALLCREERACEAYARLFQALRDEGLRWDQCRLSATLHSNQLAHALPAGTALFSTRAVSDYSVALDELRAGGRGFLQAAPAKTRRKIAAALRDYEQLGPVRVDQATDLSTAIAYLGELQRLHQAHWTAKGKPGAFASRFFADFHHAFLGRALPENLVLVSRVAAGHTVIGYKYNLLHAGCEFGYLTGLDYEVLPGRNQPGFVVNACVIEAALHRGLRTYRFMAGDQDYKKALSTHRRQVRDVVVFRRRLRGAIESRFRRLLRRQALERLPANEAAASVDFQIRR